MCQRDHKSANWRGRSVSLVLILVFDPRLKCFKRGPLGKRKLAVKNHSFCLKKESSQSRVGWKMITSLWSWLYSIIFFFFCPYILVTLKLPILSKVIAYSAIGNTRDPLVPLDSLDLSYANFFPYTASMVGLLDLTLGIVIKMTSCC